MSKNFNIRVYERDHLYPQCISYYLDLIKLSPKRYKHVLNYWSVMFFGDQYFWARETGILEKNFRAWFKKWVENKKARQDIYNFLEKNHRQLEKKMRRLSGVNIEQLDNKFLLKIRKQSMGSVLFYLQYAEYCVDLFDDYIGTLFSEKIFALIGRSPSSSDLVEFLHPSTKSVIARYHEDVLKLSLSSKISSKSIERLADKYNWSTMAWDGSGELTNEDVVQEIKELKKKSEPIRRSELKNLLQFSKRALSQRQQVLKKYHIKINDLKIYFELLDKFTLYHDYRKEIQSRSNQVIYRVLREIPKRFKLSYDDLLYYKNEEVENLLLKNIYISPALIARRQSGMLWQMNQGKIREYLGKDARTMAEKLVWSKLRNSVSEVKGLAASRGVAEGIAFVTKDAKEANAKLAKGEILVATMTLPDCVPAMKRAAAIVTDDGGATCHAAIVSRELGIPCVVGTKNATTVIKTGDKIRVDGGSGKIEILK